MGVQPKYLWNCLQLTISALSFFVCQAHKYECLSPLFQKLLAVCFKYRLTMLVFHWYHNVVSWQETCTRQLKETSPAYTLIMLLTAHLIYVSTIQRDRPRYI